MFVCLILLCLLVSRFRFLWWVCLVICLEFDFDWCLFDFSFVFVALCLGLYCGFALCFV